MQLSQPIDIDRVGPASDVRLGARWLNEQDAELLEYCQMPLEVGPIHVQALRELGLCGRSLDEQ